MSAMSNNYRIVRRTKEKFFSLFLGLGCLTLMPVFAACDGANTENKTNIDMTGTDTVTFGAGCFWCIEAVFTELKGVKSVLPGYAGGKTDNPTYKEVCSGMSGHAEVAQIIYDPQIISFKELLEVFFQTHDPTTLNRQGNDVGSQYRSVVFYHSNEQKKLTEEIIQELNASGAWPKPIVTQVVAYTKFFEAEEDHKEYYKNNPEAGYCRYVIQPKMEKFRKVFKDKLK